MNRKSVISTVLMTGAILGTVAAVPAHADGVNWSAIANCESGNDWSINTGNGYYGGLQFSHSTWQAYGGGQYAYNANGATESEQITIAKRVLAGQGIGAWPVCGKHAGSGTSYHAHKTYKAPKQPYTAPKTHTNAVVSGPVATNGNALPYPVRPTPYCASDLDRASYTVVSGDTLSSIGRTYSVTWEAIYQLPDNQGYIFDNGNLIYPGEILCIPYNAQSNN